MTVNEVIDRLRALESPENAEGMKRFGITSAKTLDIPTPVLKQLAKEVRSCASDRHALALELWATGIYDARAIAFLIDDPKLVSRKQMDDWARDFDNWATVDGACGNLFCRTPFAYEKAVEWIGRKHEFVKRAGFSLMAYLAIHDKKAVDEKLAEFLFLIEEHSGDDRNFVKKAVNWALRQIGKRSLALNRLAIESAERIAEQGSGSARWIASDALRELRSEQVQTRLQNKATK